MKKLSFIALLITILFCIDYSITQLLGFHLLFAHMQEYKIIGKVYAFIIGISAFYTILLLKKEDD